MQVEVAVDLFQQAKVQVTGRISYKQTYVNMSRVLVNLPSGEVVSTCPAAVEFRFAVGTTDGPGAFDFTQGDNQEGGLPLWLRPYEVLVTSSHTALIKTIYDTASIHSIKSRNSDVTSLQDFFCKKYVEGSPAFKLAQWNLLARSCGHNIVEYTNLQTWLVAKGDSENDTRNSDEASIIQTGLTVDVKHIFGALCAQNGNLGFIFQ